MAFSTTLPGMEEARLDAIKGVLVAALGTLNLALQRGSFWPSTVPITAAMVLVGRPLIWPKPGGVAPPLLFCVVGALDEVDVRSQIMYDEQTSTSGIGNEITTNVFALIHPDAVKVAGDVITEDEMRTRLLARLSDWMRGGVFNYFANTKIPLASQEFHTGTDLDFLDRCYASESYKGQFTESFGLSQTVFGVHLVHNSFVA